MNSWSLEERVARLEAEMAELKTLCTARKLGDPWLETVWGAFADNPAALQDAARIGREWRESFKPQETS